MPSLPVAGMSDGNQLPVAQPSPSSVPTQQPVTNSASPSMLEHMINRLTGTGGEDRYQLWPEKVVRDALSAAHDAYNSKEPLTSQDLIKPAMDISALAGTGGLAGADASLGSVPFLRPALKYEGKIYKAPMGGQHLDAIPADVYPKFQQMAMNGEDINHFNFGFMNHKGQFLDRERALDYAIKEGLLDPNSEAARANTLTSTLMADSSKPATALNLAGKSRQELERMNVDDLDRAAFGHAEGDKVTINPKDINIKYPGDLENPQAKFDKGGMNWVNSVDRSEPVQVSIDQNGKFNLEDGHHRYFAADKLNQPLQAEVEKVTGKPIEKLLNSELHKKLSKGK